MSKEPLRILVVGDLMGASASEAPPVDERPIVRVSVETLDDVFARFTPSVGLPALGLQVPLAFRALDDLHPDALFENVEIFDRFRTLRRRLQDPSTFAAAADELRSDVPAEPSVRTAESDPAATDVSPDETTGVLLDRLLGQRSGVHPTTPPPNVARAQSGIESFIRSLVAPHIVAKEDPQLPQFLSAVDAATADTMRSVLHDPAFQRLEATWRGVQWLLSRIDEGELEVCLFHLTRDELGAAAQPGSPFGLRLEPHGADALPWSLVVADFAFGPSTDDMRTLLGLGHLLSGLRVQLVAAAEGALIGCEDIRAQTDPKTWTELPADIAQLWTDVRSMPGSRFLGLAWPRLILRLPYGKNADPIEAFEFEEMTPNHSHEAYLWGNGALAAALTMARTHLGPADGLEGDIGDLPACTYQEDGEPTLKPCGEFCMTERAVDAVLALGIMPLVSYRTRNAVRLVRLQSVGATAIG